MAARRELVAEPQTEPLYLRPVPGPMEGRPTSVLVLDDKDAKASALPSGIVRVFKPDASGSLQFIGEDAIRQKAAGEPLRITLGRDAEVAVTRQQTEFYPPRQGDDSFSSAWRVTVSNHKSSAQVVKVRDVLPVNGQVTEESLPHEQPDPRTVIWSLTLPPGGQTVLTYKVQAKPR
jgi:hypothetical protein